MCGRYVNKNSIEELAKFFDEKIIIDDSSVLKPKYNICPTQFATVFTKTSEGIKLKSMRWGLIPSWSKDEKYASNLINARIETVKEKPSYKSLVKNNRCIVIANGYYECLQTSNGRQPVYIYSNHSVLPIAGLWTTWKSVNSFTIITQNSYGILKNVHPRMPLVLKSSSCQSYLDNSIDFDFSYEPLNDHLKYHKVSKAVNSVKVDDSSCLERIA